MVWKILGPLGEKIGTIVEEAPFPFPVQILLFLPLLFIGVCAWAIFGFISGFLVIRKHPKIGFMMLVGSFGSLIACLLALNHYGTGCWQVGVPNAIWFVVSFFVNPILACVLLKD